MYTVNYLCIIKMFSVIQAANGCVCVSAALSEHLRGSEVHFSICALLWRSHAVLLYCFTSALLLNFCRRSS